MFHFVSNLWNQRVSDGFYKEAAEDDFPEGFEENSCPKEKWTLTIIDIRSNQKRKIVEIKQSLRIGRRNDNDIKIRGMSQHRYELEIGMDENGVFVNSLQHGNGKYAYGDGPFNMLPPYQTIIPNSDIPLRIIYSNLLYVIEKKHGNSASKRGVIMRHDDEITQ